MGYWHLQQALKRQVLCFFYLYCFLDLVSGQIRYSVLEELPQGTLVGNVAEDLNLDTAGLFDRKLQIASEESKKYFSLDMRSGALSVKDTIDRERLCGLSTSCVIQLEVVIENPLELYRVEIEILDINDNVPSFSMSDRVLRIIELALPGARYPLESAQDPDVGINGLSSYHLSPSDYFSLSTKNRNNGNIFPELVLEKALDREQQSIHHLILTAMDGGNPPRSGSLQITVTVLDINDNVPMFDQPTYKVTLVENAPLGTLLIKLNATDLDDGPNGEVYYSFGDHTPATTLQLFEVDPKTGEITVKGEIDFEESQFLEVYVKAKDGGLSEMEGHCTVHIEIIDVNDNAPEIKLTSFSNPIPENSVLGTVVALLSIKDRDSGRNGQVRVEIPHNVPFVLKSSFENHYSLITNQELDREEVSQYKVHITASDLGSPPLSSERTLFIKIADVNDNPPCFSKPFVSAYVEENQAAGSFICILSVVDPDEGKNSLLSFSILESQVQGMPLSSYVYIDSTNGSIYSARSFDYEQIKVLQLQVKVKDAGSPSLSSNKTLHIFVLDQNDNVPVIVYPLGSKDTTFRQEIRRPMSAGYLVTKVTGVDADSGHNAWLSYMLKETTDPSLFAVAPYTGHIRTNRDFHDDDAATQRLVILVKDNGDPPLSTTLTIILILEGKSNQESSEFLTLATSPKDTSELTLYLIIALAAASVLSVVTFVVLVVRCLRNGKGNHGVYDTCCDLWRSPSRNALKYSQPHLTIKLNTDVQRQYLEEKGGNVPSQSNCYRPCFSPASDNSDFLYVKPCTLPRSRENLNAMDTSASSKHWLVDSSQVRLF
ncbi:protocadherin gamma-C5-like [Latimeria chalumnae]|uniref:protocadherin gamma-C5-like n=1 Tax=Latimeria chalumnae TaxID=7897 RepID=UPI00313D1672